MKIEEEGEGRVSKKNRENVHSCVVCLPKCCMLLDCVVLDLCSLSGQPIINNAHITVYHVIYRP